MENSDDNRRVRVIGLVLCLVTFFLYAGVLGHDFINFDDSTYVTDNSFVQNGISGSGIAWAFTTGHGSNWHPLTWISHLIDAQIYGLKHPGGHHFTNLLFHVANTLLLFLVLKRMTGAVWRSAMVAALFGWHPLHVESVAWVAERKDVLSTFFSLLTLWSYMDLVSELRVTGPLPDTPKARRYYGLTLLWFTLGLLSKPMVVTLPFVLLLLDFWPLSRVQGLFAGTDAGEANQSGKPDTQPTIRRLIEEKLPFFALTFVLCVVTFMVQRGGGAMAFAEKIPFPLRFANALQSYVVYLRKMLWPSDLAIFYPFPGTLPASHWLMAGVFLATVSIVVIKLARTRPYLVVGWFWFLGMLVPVIGLIQVGSQALADRYTYLPLVGIFIMLVWGAGDLLGERNALRSQIAWAIAVPVLAACLVLTWQQDKFWKNSETLFRHALAVTKDNVVAYIDLGRALDDSGRPEEAKAEYDAALKLEPKSPAALTSLGVHFAKQGDVTNALGYYRSALINEPYFSDAHYNLGNVLARQGKLAEAAKEYAEALQLKPDSPDAHNNLGAVLFSLGKTDEAVGELQSALRLRPNYPEAHTQLGAILLRKGALEEARAHFAESVRLKPDVAYAQLRLGLIMAQQGDVALSIPHFQTAVELEPRNFEAHFNLGAAFAAMGNWAPARDAFTDALKVKPGDALAQRRLNEAEAKMGKSSGASPVASPNVPPTSNQQPAFQLSSNLVQSVQPPFVPTPSNQTSSNQPPRPKE